MSGDKARGALREVLAHLARALVVGAALGAGVCLAASERETAAAREQASHDPSVSAPSGVQAMWRRFLTEASFQPVMEAYGAVSPVFLPEGGVDPDTCRAQAEAIASARATVPVGLGILYASLLCAEATGDEATAERDLGVFQQLSRDAFAQGGLAGTRDVPIRIVHESDVWALVAAAEHEVLSAAYESARFGRHLPFALVLWDADAERERHLRFDYLDTWMQLLRSDPDSEFAAYRFGVARAVLEGDADSPDSAAGIARRVRTALEDPNIDSRINAMLALAAEGHPEAIGLVSAHCLVPESTCAERTVDVLLPLAERGLAQPAVMLALALGTGAGVERDLRAARLFISRADARLGNDGGVLAAVGILMVQGRADDTPRFLRTALRRVSDAGDPIAAGLAAMVEWNRDRNTRLSPRELASLRRAADAGSPAFAAAYAFALLAHGDAGAGEALGIAAEAGFARAQLLLARRLAAEGGEARDRTAELRWLVQAAHGGEVEAAVALAVHYQRERDLRRAEGWYESAAMLGHGAATLEWARLLIAGGEGVRGTPAEGLQILRNIVDSGESPEARRELAGVLLRGAPALEADPAAAAELLREDAARSDPDAQAMLASALLWSGVKPRPDEDAEHMLREAAERGSADAMQSLAMAMYAGRTRTRARAEIVGLLRKAAESGGYMARNNLAWILCTSTDPEFHDPAEGQREAALLLPESEGVPPLLDTIAACHAASGDFAAAVASQQSALATAQTLGAAETALAGYRDRLAQLQRGEAIRETPTDTVASADGVRDDSDAATDPQPPEVQR